MVQTRLKESGFDPGPIDGLAGKRTLAALNAYRESVRLNPVLVVSRETIGACRFARTRFARPMSIAIDRSRSFMRHRNCVISAPT